MLRTSTMSCLLMILGLALGVMGQEQPSPFGYVKAKAYHIPPETTTEESGYFSLCEGADGKIYIGTAAYGRNAYLVELRSQDTIKRELGYADATYCRAEDQGKERRPRGYRCNVR